MEDGKMLELLRDEFDLVGHSLEPLSGGRVNHLFRCGAWVAKVYDHLHVPRARAEMAVKLMESAAAGGLPVPRPLLTRSGSSWAESTDGMVTVMPFVRGLRFVRGTLNLAEAASLGKALGSLHNAFRGASYQVAAPSPLEPAAIAQRWEALRRQALSTGRATDFDLLVAEAAEYASAALPHVAPVDWNTQSWQLCHGDPHPDNVLFNEQGQVVAVLDFDNAAASWAEAELMMAWNLCICPEPERPAFSPEAIAFFGGYRQVNPRIASLGMALRAYWFTLMSSTWPAALRYQGSKLEPKWVQVFSMRYKAARWLQTHLDALTKELEA